MHDDATAASVIEDLVNNTLKDYAHIRHKIEEYGNQIIKRWQKKSAGEREQLIFIAMPTILKDRFSEIECMFEDFNYAAGLLRGQRELLAARPADQQTSGQKIHSWCHFSTHRLSAKAKQGSWRFCTIALTPIQRNGLLSTGNLSAKSSILYRSSRPTTLTVSTSIRQTAGLDTWCHGTRTMRTVNV